MLRCYTRDNLSFVLLLALQLTLLVQKDVGTPFPPHYTPG